VQQVADVTHALPALLHVGPLHVAAVSVQEALLAQQYGVAFWQHIPGMALPQSIGASAGQASSAPHLPPAQTRSSRQSAVMAQASPASRPLAEQAPTEMARIPSRAMDFMEPPGRGWFSVGIVPLPPEARN
jgi:hypothetical protein